MPKAILFDLDGTLRYSEPEGYDTFVHFYRELGGQLPDQGRERGQRWAHYYWASAPEMVEDLRELGTDTPEFWERYTQRQITAFGLEADATLGAQVHARMRAEYRPIDVVPADVRPTLQRLRAAGRKLGLVSNRAETLQPVADRLGLADLFDVILSAGEVGSWKPDPVIFQSALARLGLTPAEAIYVGDNYYADVEGARHAGLGQVLIDPRGLYAEPACPVIRTIGELEDVCCKLDSSARIP